MAAVLDATKLRIFQNEQPAVVPNPDKIQFGKTVTGMFPTLGATEKKAEHRQRPHASDTMDRV